LDWQFESISSIVFEADLTGQVCTGIFLDHPSKEHDGNAIIMVLTQKGEVYERTGLGKIFNYKRFGKNGQEVVTSLMDPALLYTTELGSILQRYRSHGRRLG